MAPGLLGMWQTQSLLVACEIRCGLEGSRDRDGGLSSSMAVRGEGCKLLQ